MKNSEIKINVLTDVNNLPESIAWSATDSDVEGQQESKAMMLALWDTQNQNTLKIDLWTKDMLVDEMKLFFYQTLVSMTATFERATGEESMAKDMKEFCKFFAEKMEIEK